MSVKKTTGFVVAVMFCLPILALAQTPGTISGRVIDAKTGDPLPGANVLLKGTGLGASTTLNGRYSISNVPPGPYTMRVSYIGYRNLEVAVKVEPGIRLLEDLELQAVGVKAKGVTVTAQASGQNALINQQLSSQNIVNVVSAARIQALPDANAAESVGRLPGVYLLRSGGEGYEVAIRGLQPKYNEVMIDGVQMAATSTSNRAVDMSMISSNMLNSIKVYKTVTPDMDAAVLGGVVDFGIREARRTPSGAPEVDLSAQGGYNGLQNAYSNDYKFSGAIGDRYFDNKFGILVQGVVENVDLTDDQLSAGYAQQTQNFNAYNPLLLQTLTLTYTPRQRQRYDATVSMDYRLPKGKLDFMNFFSRGYTHTQNRAEDYDLNRNYIIYKAGASQNTLNTLVDLLDFKQDISSFNLDVRFSQAYSDNYSPPSWGLSFQQSPAGLNTVPAGENPVLIAEAGQAMTNLDNMFLNGISSSNSYNKQRNLTGSIDIDKSFDISDFVTAKIKFGGKYRYTYRWYSTADGSGNIYDQTAVNLRADIIEAMPWMAEPPYNVNPNGSAPFPFAMFEDPSYRYGNFLNGNYSIGPGTNLGLLSQVMNLIKKYTVGMFGFTGGPYTPNTYDAVATNYTGNEYESAAYAMVTLNIGPQLTIIPGVRYQGLKTSYTAARIPTAYRGNTFPLPYPYQDTTIDQYHGYWLPDISMNYKPLSWLGVRASYTNTLTYPDFTSIVPIIDIFSSTVTWHNYALKPARSQNYDLALSVYNNSIGLLTVDGFLKRIDNLIFGLGSTYITDPSEYPGLPEYTKGYELSTKINDPFRVNVWGTEFDWQTHFWYLPGLLTGFVFDVNYTHIFSGAKYPYALTILGGFPKYIPVHIDTFYTARLVDQPNNIVNLSAGYDFKGFSVVVSMIYQADVFTSANFWPELRQNKAKYVRWDLAIKQNLPWAGMQAYFNLNNINGESDVNLLQGSGYPTSEQDYGMTADFGLRWSLQ